MVGQAWNVPDHGLTCGHCGWTVEAFPGRPLLEEEPPPEFFFLYLYFLLEPPACRDLWADHQIEKVLFRRRLKH